MRRDRLPVKSAVFSRYVSPIGSAAGRRWIRCLIRDFRQVRHGSADQAVDAAARRIINERIVAVPKLITDMENFSVCKVNGDIAVGVGGAVERAMGIEPSSCSPDVVEIASDKSDARPKPPKSQGSMSGSCCQMRSSLGSHTAWFAPMSASWVALTAHQGTGRITSATTVFFVQLNTCELPLIRPGPPGSNRSSQLLTDHRQGCHFTVTVLMESGEKGLREKFQTPSGAK